MENSDYCNLETDEKDCYQTVGGHDNIGCMYSTYAFTCHRVIDSYFVVESRNCYECIQVFNSQDIFRGHYIENCFNNWFVRDISGCQNVLFGCGLRNVSYVYKNKILEKEEREEVFATYKQKMETPA